MKSFFKTKGIRGLAFSFICALLFLIISLSGILDGIDNYLMDHIIQHEGSVNTDIKIIAIDDKSLNEMGKMDTWDRSYYASLINKLNSDEHKPSVIGFDILFTGKSDNEEADRSLVEAVSNSSNVILGMNLIFDSKLKNDTIASDIKVSYPFDELKEAGDCAYVNTILDNKDNYVRRVIPKMDSYESFSYMIYRKYMEGRNEGYNKFEAKAYRFKYSAKPSSAYTVISLTDILNDRIPLADFKDSIVLVGAYTTGLSDDFYTPIKRGSKMHGVEIHANLIDAYTHNNLISDFNNTIRLVISFLLVFIISYLLFNSKIVFSSVVTLFSGFILALLEATLIVAKVYLPLNLEIFIIVIAYIYQIAYGYLKERRAKLNTILAFKKYVAPQVVDKAIENGHFEINLGGEKRNVACLFVDIRGFTSMSEAMEAGEVVEILNSYLSLVTDAIFKNGGTLDKFIGDAAMALFNAPFDLDDYIYRAVKCAIDIRAGSESLDKECQERFNRSVGFGIGINVGDAVVGNIGSTSRMDYTAIGDTINTASRLEGSSKRGEIVVSEAVYLAVKDRVNAKYIGELTLKGKKDGFRAYLILDLKEE